MQSFLDKTKITVSQNGLQNNFSLPKVPLFLSLYFRTLGAAARTDLETFGYCQSAKIFYNPNTTSITS